MIQGSEAFLRHKYTHTTVLHKKKPGREVRYVEQKTITLPDGERRTVLAGTQKIDGFWAYFRRLVGRRSVNTGDNSSHKRAYFHSLVRVAQFHQWFLHEDRFALLGQM